MNYLDSLTGSEWIASISLIIALGSAIFAHRSWIESKKANRISIHPIQVEIYDAFNDLHINFRANKIFTDTNKTTGFYKFSEKAEFYFDENLSKQLKDYFDVYRKLSVLQLKYNNNINISGSNDIIKLIFKDVDKLLEEEEILYKKIKENFKIILKISGFKQ